jgi:hypothetical protein
MRVSRLVVAAVIAISATVPAVAVTTAAVAAPSAVAGQAKSKPKPVRAVKAKPVPFTAVGTVTAIDLDTRSVQVAVTGGTRDVRGSEVTLTVAPTSRVRVDDAAGALADVQVGAAVTITGRRAATNYTVLKVNAANPLPVHEPIASP